MFVLNFHHLAEPAAGIERADDPVAHFVAGCELRVLVPDFTANDIATERLRDLEAADQLPLRNVRIRTRSDFANNLPVQPRVASRRLVEPLASVQQPLLLRFADAPVAAPLVLRHDSE